MCGRNFVSSLDAEASLMCIVFVSSMFLISSIECAVPYELSQNHNYALTFAVKDVVLEYKENVKQNGKEAETKLCNIAKEDRPVVCVVRLQRHLKNAKRAA